MNSHPERSFYGNDVDPYRSKRLVNWYKFVGLMFLVGVYVYSMVYFMDVLSNNFIEKLVSPLP